jgi:hypothetical protein
VLKRAVAVALVLVAATAAARSPKRHGKRGRVVKVERVPTRAHASARVCTNVDSAGNSTCYGLPPRLNDEGYLLDNNAMYGDAELTRIDVEKDRCGNVTDWKVMAAAQGDISKISYGTLVFDDTLLPTARTIDTTGLVGPGAYPGEVTMTAVDDDADGKPDLLVTYYYCDTTGAPQATGAQNAYCLVYYGNEGDGVLAQQRVDVVRMCF